MQSGDGKRRPLFDIERSDIMIYAAFLKGINVGGHNKVKMADFRQMLEALGYLSVKTYIQSGNAVFSSESGEDEVICEITAAMKESFGFSAGIMLRRMDELVSIVEKCPYLKRENQQTDSGAKRLYVGMTNQIIEKSIEEKLLDIKETGDDFCIAGRNIYLWFDEGVGRSKFATRLASALDPVTLRNWNTMSKVYDMAQSIK